MQVDPRGQGHAIADEPSTAASVEPMELVLVARHRFGGFPPLGDWQMAKALARRHRVLYVDPPHLLLRAKPRRRVQGDATHARRTGFPQVRRVAEWLWVATPTVLPGVSRPGLSRLADVAMGLQIDRISRRLFDGPPVLVSFDPLRGGLRGMRGSLSAYWRRDSFADSRSSRASWMQRREAVMLREAAVVSCVSETLAEQVRAFGHPDVHVIPNGCDAEHFGRPQSRPDGFPHAPVVLGFVGGGWWRLDTELVRQVARRRPEWAIVLVGQSDGVSFDEPNIHEVPYVDYARIPAWMQYLDVGFVPYSTSLPFNQASFPLKVYEHLAAGVPVVGTSLPAFSGLAPFVRCADTADEVLAAVESVLRDGPEARDCRAVAARNTWDDRAQRLVAALDAARLG